MKFVLDTHLFLDESIQIYQVDWRLETRASTKNCSGFFAHSASNSASDMHLQSVMKKREMFGAYVNMPIIN